MLASINPLGERGRHQRYWVTVTAYVVSSTLAGGALGAVLGGAGAPIASPVVAAAVLAGVAALGLAMDARRFGLRVPGPRRQVNEDWLARYRGWVYGAGFGAQLGFAFATIVVASITWVAFVCALLAGSAPGGAVIGAVFGLTRAVSLLVARGVRDPAALRTLVRRLERVRPRLAALATAAQASAVAAPVALLAMVAVRA